MSDTAITVRQTSAIAPVTTESQMALVRQQAELFVASGFAPEGMTAPQAAILVMAGREMGIAPMHALKHGYVVKGRYAWDGTVIAALFRQAGHDFAVIESKPDTCTIRFYLKTGREYDYTLTMKECVEAGWTTDSKGTKYTYKNMPRTMLRWRTLTNGIRAGDPGSLFGSLMSDELDAETGDQGDMMDEREERGQVTERQPEQSEQSTEPHWTTQSAHVRGFWKWAQEKTLTTIEVYEALGNISELSEYKGTKDEARAAIQAWLNENTAQAEVAFT